MVVHFSQIYIQPGATFPFSHHFQRRFSDEVTERVSPSPRFIATFGADWDLIFRISAKGTILENEIRGPTVFKKDKQVEYTVFLPFDAVVQHTDVSQSALRFLIDGCCSVFAQLEIDSEPLKKSVDELIASICANPDMFRATA